MRRLKRRATPTDEIGVGHTRVTTVRREEVQAFAAALGEPVSSKGTSLQVVPLGYIARVAADAALRCVHHLVTHPSVTELLQVSHDQELHRLMEVGEDVTTTAVVTDRRAVAGGTLATVSATQTSDRGPVGRSTGVLLLRGLESEVARSGRLGPLGRRDVDGAAFVSCGTIQLTHEHTRDYAIASRDPNPVHRDPAVARAVGYPDIIVPGLCLLWLTAARIVHHFADDDPSRVARIRCRFAAPGLPGDELQVLAGPLDDGSIGFRLAGPRRAVLKAGSVELRPSPVERGTAP
jgi:acyl dehydratase